MDSSGLQWTPGGLQVDSRKFSSNMTIFVESWWTPAGVHQIHQDYLEYVEQGKVLTHCLVTLKKLRKGVVIEWVVAAPGWLSSFGVRGGQTNGRGSYSNGQSVGVRGEAKRKGGGHMGWLSSVGCEVGPKEWPGIVFEWAVGIWGDC